MSTKTNVQTTGAIWNLFYADKAAWPYGAHHDDTLLAIRGKEAPDVDIEKLPPDATVEIRSGYVMLPNGSDLSLEQHFENWLAQQSGRGVALGAFRVSMDKLAAVRQAIEIAGGELIA
jgi:hypothetical protein